MRYAVATSGILVCSALCLAPLRLSADETKSDDASAEQHAAKASVAGITLKGGFPESAGQLGLLGDMGPNLRAMIGRLDRAAADDDVSSVLLRIRNPDLGRGKLAELRAAIGRVRESGKRVFAELQMAETSDYLLACACDKIVMPESGVLMIPGVRAEVTFYKGLFDKLGVEADFLQMGDFKGAAEPFTRTGMSPQFRKQFESVVDDLYAQVADMIAEGRGLDAKQARDLIDRGIFTPAEAKQAGLIDVVAYSDDFQQSLEQELNAREVSVVKDYGKKKVENEFSGMLGMMKLFEMMMGIEPSQRASRNKKIAVVYAVGAITTGESSVSLFGGETMGSETIVKALRQANDDKTVAAIVLRVDSPGGSALASDLIWKELQSIEKPVYASMGDTAASGGYYISMGCDRIFAEPGTLTGSIGVVGGKFALQGLYGKVGLSSEVISRGKNSGLLAFDAPFTQSEREAMEGMMREVYRQFVSKSAAGRKMDAKELEKLAGGRIWTGRQAQQNGLVDELGTLKDTLLAAKQAAGLEKDEKAELLLLPKPKSLLDQLLEGGSPFGANVKNGIDAVAPRATRQLERAAMLQKVFEEPAVLLTPYQIDIR